MRQKIPWVALFAISMAFFEAAVVVYLRALFYPEGFAFPLRYVLPPHVSESLITLVELAREAASILMILAVAWLAAAPGRTSAARWERFAWFAFIFGVWDVFYYVFLWAAIRWPASLADWDVLFLFPLPWLGPVWAPVVIALSLIAASILILRLLERGVAPRVPAWAWALAVAGGLVVIVSFALDGWSLVELRMPAPFKAWLFWAGWAMGAAGFAAGWKKTAAGHGV
jgi:hypothetical protein